MNLGISLQMNLTTIGVVAGTPPSPPINYLRDVDGNIIYDVNGDPITI